MTAVGTPAAIEATVMPAEFGNTDPVRIITAVWASQEERAWQKPGPFLFSSLALGLNC